MDLEKSMELVLTELRGLRTDMDDVKSDISVLKTDVAVLKTDVAGIKSELKVVNSRLDRLEQGQADILEQQREHTVLIHALMDGQVTLEERIADFRKECNQKITVLAEWVYECEQATCRNSYDIALLKMAK